MLFASNHTDGREPKVIAGRRSGADVVGVGAAEREKGVMAQVGGGRDVVLQLPPFVARNLRMDQVIALEVQADAVAGQNGVVQLLDRRWKAQVEDWDRVS